MSLRRRLLYIFITLTSLPIFALGLLSAWQNYRSLTNEAINTQNQIAQQIALQAEDYLEHQQFIMEVLIQGNALSMDNAEQQKHLLSQFMAYARNVEEAWIADANGNEMTRVSKSKIITKDDLHNIINTPEFHVPISTGNAYYSSIFTSPDTNKPIITISIPIVDPQTGEPAGIMAASIEADEVWQLVAKKSEELQQDIFITTADGVIVAHPNSSVILSRTIYTLPAKNIGPDFEGRTAIIGSAEFTMGSQTFKVVSSRSVKEVLSQIFISVSLTLVFVLVTAIASVYFAWLAGNRISLPIITLAKQAKAIEAGDLDFKNNINTRDEVGLLASAINSMTRKIKARNKQINAVQQSTLSILGNLNLDQVLENILNQVTRILNTEHSFLYLLEENESAIKMRVATGVNRQFLDATIQPGQGLAGTVFQTGRPLMVRDYQMWEGRADIFKKANFSAMAGIPLHSGGKTIGVLGIDFTEPDQEISPEDVDLLINFGQLASIAIENARLYQIAQTEIKERQRAEHQSQQQVERLNALRTIDMFISSNTNLNSTLKVLLDQIIVHLNVDAANILYYNPSINIFEFAEGIGLGQTGKQTSINAAQENLARHAILQRRTIYIEDITKDSNFKNATGGIFKNFVSYYGVPLFTKGEAKGILEIRHKSTLHLSSENINFLETLAGQAAIAIDSYNMFNSLERSNTNLNLAYETTLEGWSAALDLRDKETEGHTRRVTNLTIEMAKVLNVSDEEFVNIKRGALLHDIGKMGIPDNILQKDGPLTKDERLTIEKHPSYAYNLLYPIEYLRPALDIPYCHHEKWDGSGYPRGLKGEQIPFAARLFAIADVYDALTSDRHYRKGWSTEEAINYIKAESGKHFDPGLVKVFLSVLKENQKV